METQQTLSRDERKLQQIELLFRKQEERAKKKLEKQQRKLSITYSLEGSETKEIEKPQKKRGRKRYCIYNLTLQRKIPEITAEPAYKFTSQQDFCDNFGKENWLYAYQKAEIERNRQSTAQCEQQLGTITLARELPRPGVESDRNSWCSNPMDTTADRITNSHNAGDQDNIQHQQELLATVKLYNSIRSKFIKSLKHKYNKL